MGKIIVTQYKDKVILLWVDDQNHPILIRGFEKNSSEELLGGIYIGKITEIVSGMEGAFAAIGPDQRVFFSLKETRKVLLVNREYDGKLKPEDELVLQVVRSPLKSKQAGASLKLSLTGQYCVCYMEDHRMHRPKEYGPPITYSRKLYGDKLQKIKEAVEQMAFELPDGCSYTVRTNAGELADFSLLFEEMKRLGETFIQIKNTYRHRTCYTCLYHPQPEVIKALLEIPLPEYDEVVTDIPSIYELLSDYLDKPLRLYQDALLPLAKLYSLTAHIEQALARKVWLPCGGYLVIEPTEAMTVIDVNSGKATGGKTNQQDNLCLKTNLEAAKEIARQLRLRNISGMIMVDFINMKTEADKERLLKELGIFLKRDRIKTRLVDMTPLGIVEITRKKEHKPLWEQLK